MPVLLCMACGSPLEPGLARLGSARCHDCRDDEAPFDPVLVSGGGVADDPGPFLAAAENA